MDDDIVVEMKTRELRQLDANDEEIAATLIALGMSKPVARTLSYLKNVEEATSIELERGTGLRQPEISIAMKQLKERNWIMEREDKKPCKGRPYNVYSLKVGFNEIISYLEEQQKKSVRNTQLNNYLLSDPLQRGIQGLVGEMVAVDYVIKNIKDKASQGDEVMIITNRCNNIKPKGNYWNQSTLVKCFPIYKSPSDFLQDDFVDKLLKIGCEGIDLANADIEAKNLFERHISKTKEQMLSDLDHLYIDYRGEREREEEKRKKEKEALQKMDISQYEKNEPKIPEIIKNLSHKDLAKVLTLVELERGTKRKNVFGFSDLIDRIHSIVTFSRFLIPSDKAKINYNDRKYIKTISKYVNAKYEELNLLSSVFKSIVQTKTRIDLMIVHCSEEETLKKIIIIECKTGDAVLSKPQKAFIDCIKQINSDKVEYKVINVGYQAPKQLVVREITH